MPPKKQAKRKRSGSSSSTAGTAAAAAATATAPEPRKKGRTRGKSVGAASASASAAAAAKPVKALRNYINGKWCTTKKHLVSLNPATNETNATVPASTAKDVNEAVDAALAAFPSWSGTSKRERASVLYRIANAIERRLPEFAAAESADQGKPVWLAQVVDIPRSCYNFRFFADVILHEEESATIQELEGNGRALNYTQHVPVGVAGLVTPWNLPLYLLTWKVAPALAFGNCVVAKPSEFTSVTAYMLAEVMDEVGLPAGVFNLVMGDGKGAGQALVAHPKVPLVSFTGGTATGQRIASTAAPLFKKMSLELGGKNPALIFEDVNIPAVVDQTIRSSFTNQGEICLCSSRIYVQDTIFDDFILAFVSAAKAVTVGDPSTQVQLGALVSKPHLEKVRGYVRIAKKSGAVIHCGEGVDDLKLPDHCAEGNFMRPTIVTNVGESHPCIQEEIFGPVVMVVPFHTEDEAVRLANSTKYGLSAVVCTKDGSRAQRVAQKLDAGTCWINCWMVRDLHMPFGGLKQSGTGRESAEASREFFTEVKTICTKI